MVTMVIMWATIFALVLLFLGAGCDFLEEEKREKTVVLTPILHHEYHAIQENNLERQQNLVNR